ASPVSDDYDGESSVFTGTVNWVQIDLGDDAEDADHLITPDERLKVAMARRSRQPNPGMPWVRPSRAEVEPRSRQPAADASIKPAVVWSLRLAGLHRSDAVGAHHLVVLVFDDVAVPDE